SAATLFCIAVKLEGFGRFWQARDAPGRAFSVIRATPARQTQKKCLTLESVPRLIISAVNGGNDKNGYLRSGRLAELTGVSTDTLRHYERLGLLLWRSQDLLRTRGRC